MFALFGVALGVACLVVTMAVVSGYESTLTNSIKDYAGHVDITKRGGGFRRDEKFLSGLADEIEGFKAYTPYLQFEGMIAYRGKISGVIAEGLDPDQYSEVLDLAYKIREGSFALSLSEKDKIPQAVIGREIAKRFSLQVGDVFSLVRPVASQINSDRLRPRIKKLKVAGVIDLGKVEYNQRAVLVSLSLAQQMTSTEGYIAGVRLRLDEKADSQAVASYLSETLGYPYFVRDWRDVNSNLLEAIRLERPLIFFVVFIIVIAACFNVCSHLFINVLQRYSDISIMRSLGASKSVVIAIFAIQGFVLGALGTLLGLFCGGAFSFLFSWVQATWNIIPGEAYKLSNFAAELRFIDIMWISLITVIICTFSALPAAFRGAKISPVEGLKYE